VLVIFIIRILFRICYNYIWTLTNYFKLKKGGSLVNYNTLSHLQHELFYLRFLIISSCILIALLIVRKGIPLVFFNLYNSFSTLVAVFNFVTSALVKVSVCMIVIAFMVCVCWFYYLYGFRVHYVTKKDLHFCKSFLFKNNWTLPEHQFIEQCKLNNAISIISIIIIHKV